LQNNSYPFVFKTVLSYEAKIGSAVWDGIFIKGKDTAIKEQ